MPKAKNTRGKGRKKGGGKKKKGGRSAARGAKASPPSSDDGYDAIPDITFDEYGRTLCADHHLECCHICCMSFTDQNREIDENPSDRDVGVFISDAALIDWHSKLVKERPQLFTEGRTVFGKDPGQYPYGTKLLAHFDGDRNKPLQCIVVGSRWKQNELDLPGIPSFFPDGREPFYSVFINDELSQIELMDAHSEWKVVGREAKVNPRLDVLARAHRKSSNADDVDSESSSSEDDSKSHALSTRTANNCIRRTVEMLQRGDLPLKQWDARTHGDFLEQFFMYSFYPEEQELIMNSAPHKNRKGIAEHIKAFPMGASEAADKKNFYARVVVMQMVAFYVCDHYGGVILQNTRRTKFQAIEFNGCHLSPDSVPLLEITYATDPEGIERPTGYLRDESIKIMEVSNELAVVLEDHLLNCVANEGLIDLSGLLYHKGYLLPMESRSSAEPSLDFANSQTPDVNFGVELELSCASGNYPWNIAPSLAKHAKVEVVRSGRSSKVGKGGAVQAGFVTRQKHRPKGSDQSASKHDKWKLAYDASISPTSSNPQSALFELVSPILSGNTGLDLLTDMVTVATDVACIRVNASMGLHVHVEANHFSLNSMKSICQQFLIYEEVVDSFLPSNRRTGSDKSHSYFESNLLSMMSYYGTLAGSLEEIEACQSHDDLYEMMNPGIRERYHKLNLQNLKTGRQPTIEFRQHHATKDSEEIVAWVRFCVLFVVNAAKLPAMDGSIPGDASFDSLFANIIKCPILKEYYSRKASECRRQ